MIVSAGIAPGAVPEQCSEPFEIVTFPEKKLVILATQRSGSTLLCEDLRSYGVFGDPDEHFLLMLRRHAVPDWPQMLRELVDKRAPNGVFAVKLMVNYAQAVDDRLRDSGIVPEQPDPSLFPHIRRFSEGADWIWIRRRDVIRQAVSREMSRQTGVNHAVEQTGPVRYLGRTIKGYTDDYNADAVLDVDAIVTDVESIAMEEAVIARFLDEHALPCRTVWYEDYVSNYMSTLKECAAAFGTTIADRQPERRLVKLSNDKSEHYVRLATEKIKQDIQLDL